jgi:hypothetical protein
VYLDTLQLLNDDIVVFECKCQSVSNHPKSDVDESIAPGEFQIKLFQQRRAYVNPVHVVMNAEDMEGEWIGEDGMQDDAESGRSGRWLVHDDCNPATLAPYSAPWSAGCIILPMKEHARFNAKLTGLGFKSGDVLEAALMVKE